MGGWTSQGAGISSLLVGIYRKGALCYIGRVGTGLGAVTLRELWPCLARLEGTQSPFSGRLSIPARRQIHWIRPELVVEIEFSEWTGDGQLRGASYKRIRRDRGPSQVQAIDAEGPVDTAPMALPPSRHRAKRKR